MTMTTIKVSSSTRDRLKAQAKQAGRTLGDHLAHLADAAEKRDRFDRLKRQIAATPAVLLESYADESAEWDAVDGGR